MPTAFKASVITPESILLEADVTSAQIPAYDGLVGILHMRAPLLAKLGTGVLQLETAQGTQRFVVSGGYAQMKDDVLTIISSDATPATSVTTEMIANEEERLRSLNGADLPAMGKRQEIQARIQAMKQVLSN
jgi:F-type H+-transporting ATPase subunit epsilon